MIEMSILKKSKNGQVTLKSMMQYLLMCDDSERWAAFYEVANGELASEYPMNWKTFWKCLQFAYSEGRANPSEASDLFLECEFDWYDYSTREEKEFYDGIDNDQYIYRGCTKEELESGEFGISWTTDKGVAEFFAYRFKDSLEKNGKHPCVVSIKASDAHICGVLLDRNEKEVIIPNTDGNVYSVELDSEEPTDAYEEYMAKRKSKAN